MENKISTWASRVLLGMIGLFALTTVGNVSYFVETYHAGWGGYTLGGAFGLALFLSAFYMSQGRSSETRRTATILAAVFGLSSGYFQFSVYAEHATSAQDVANALLLAFVPILGGEAGLAWLEASVSRDDELATVADYEAQITALTAERDNLGHELELSRQHVQTLTGQNADMSRQIEKLSQENAALSAQLTRTDGAGQLVISPQDTPPTGERQPNQNLSPADRRRQLLDMLTADYLGHDLDNLDRSGLAVRFDVSPKTIGRDIDRIRTERGWNGVVSADMVQ